MFFLIKPIDDPCASESFLEATDELDAIRILVEKEFQIGPIFSLRVHGSTFTLQEIRNFKPEEKTFILEQDDLSIESQQNRASLRTEDIVLVAKDMFSAIKTLVSAGYTINRLTVYKKNKTYSVKTISEKLP